MLTLGAALDDGRPLGVALSGAPRLARWCGHQPDRVAALAAHACRAMELVLVGGVASRTGRAVDVHEDDGTPPYACKNRVQPGARTRAWNSGVRRDESRAA